MNSEQASWFRRKKMCKSNNDMQLNNELLRQTSSLHLEIPHEDTQSCLPLILPPTCLKADGSILPGDLGRCRCRETPLAAENESVIPSTANREMDAYWYSWWPTGWCSIIMPFWGDLKGSHVTHSFQWLGCEVGFDYAISLLTIVPFQKSEKTQPHLENWRGEQDIKSELAAACWASFSVICEDICICKPVISSSLSPD